MQYVRYPTLDINLFISEMHIFKSVAVLSETELGRSKISSRYQIVLPEGVRRHLNLTGLDPGKDYYAYFYEADGEVRVKVAVVEKKEEVKFLDEEESS